MIRLLAALLIFTTLVGNTAWALDIHFDDWDNRVVAEFNASHHGSNATDDVPACPDHCSHGAAHLLGLHMETSTFNVPSHGRSEFAYSNRLSTRFPVPPSKPPRA